MITAIKYSDKSIAIYGDTKPVKETLKEKGGRFNAFLNIEGKKQAGWIFSAKNEYAQAMFALSNVNVTNETQLCTTQQ